MPEFKSTVKITPELLAEFQKRFYLLPDRLPGKPQYITYSIAATISILIILLSPDDVWHAMAILALLIICYLFVLPLYLRFSTRVQMKLNKRLFGTPTPTYETWLENDKIVEHCIESGSTKRQSLSYAKVYPAANYIFIHGNWGQIFAFAKSDFTEDELSALLMTLRKLCDKIMPNS